MQSEKIIKMQLEEKKAILKALKENDCTNKEQILNYTNGYIAALEFVLSEDSSINYVHISNLVIKE